MTKEEAIKAIEEYLDTADEAGHVFPIEFLTALDVAILSLSEKDNTMEWIEHKSKKGTTLAVTCSKCLKPTKQGIKYPFCPHCGRKAGSE